MNIQHGLDKNCLVLMFDVCARMNGRIGHGTWVDRARQARSAPVPSHFSQHLLSSTFRRVMNDHPSSFGRMEDERRSSSPKRKKVRQKYAPKACMLRSRSHRTSYPGCLSIPTIPESQTLYYRMIANMAPAPTEIQVFALNC